MLRFSKNEILHGVFSLTFAPESFNTTLHVLADPNLGYRFYAALARVLYRGDHMKLDDANWHCFTLSRYDRSSGKWAMEKAPVYHIVD